MTKPSAEVMISPEIDRNALNKMNSQISNSAKKLGDDAEQHIRKGVTSGFKTGIMRGRAMMGRVGKGIGGAARAGFDNLGGARGIATGLGGLALAGLIDAIDRAAKTRDTIGGTLGESTAGIQLARAKGSGFSADEFGQFSAQLQNIGGLQDTTAISDLLSDLNVRITESISEEGTQRLEEFGKFKGQERINRLLASLSQLKGKEGIAEAQQILDEVGIAGDDRGALMTLIQEAGKGRTGSEAYDFLNRSNQTEGQRIGANLEKEAGLAKQYRDAQLKFNNEMRTNLLNNIDKEKIDLLFETRTKEADAVVENVKNFKDNQKIATEAMDTLKATLGTLNKTTVAITEGITDLIDTVVDVFGDDTAKKAREATNRLSEGWGGATGTIDRSNRGG